MKKAFLLLTSIVSLSSLVSCDVSNNSVNTNEFEKQLLAAGIKKEFKSIDELNKAITNKYEHNGNSDVTAGASGPNTDFYPFNPNGAGGTYSSLDEMVQRANLNYYVKFYWKEVTEIKTGATSGVNNTAKTLEEASKLPYSEYVTEAFPNDGKTYQVANYKNAVATKQLSTYSKDESGNVKMYNAIYGMAAKKEDNSHYVYGSITGKATLYNLIENGTGMITMYEYNFTTGDKVGPGARNYGCRLDVELDWSKTSFNFKDDKTPYTFENKEALYKKAGGKENVKNVVSSSIMLKATKMYTLG